MTHKVNDIAICPNCGHKQTMTVWNVVNGDVNTKTKHKILNGTFFDQTCKECGKTFEITYQTLFEDNTHGALIYYAQTAMQESVAIQTVFGRRKHIKTDTDYAIRIVKSPHKFSEKVKIFDCGLDDRLIEIMKVAILEKINEDNALGHVDDVLCWCDKSDGDFELEILGDRRCMCGVRREFYKYIESKCKKLLDKKGENPVHIDFCWALEFLEENHFRCI